MLEYEQERQVMRQLDNWKKGNDNMKNAILFFYLMVLSIMSLYANDTNSYFEPASDEKILVSSSVELPFLSSYVWRGQVINDKAVFQPSLTLSGCGLSVNVWNNFNLTDNDATKHIDEKYDFTETDITVWYSYSLSLFTASAGIIQYMFPNSTIISTDEKGNEKETNYPATRECYISIVLDKIFLSPACSLYYDIGEVHGVYGNASLSYTRRLPLEMALSASASLGYADNDYNSYYFAYDGNAFNDANFLLKLEYPLNRYFSISPSIQYTYLIDNDIRDAADDLYSYHKRIVASITLRGNF